MATPFSYVNRRGRIRLDASRIVRWLDASGTPLILAGVLAVMAAAAYLADPEPAGFIPPLHAIRADL